MGALRTVNRRGARIEVAGLLDAFSHAMVLRELYWALDEGLDDLQLDLSGSERAYQDGVVPLICTLDYLRELGIRIAVNVPAGAGMRQIFAVGGWTALLGTSEGSSPGAGAQTATNVPATRFRDAAEQAAIVNSMMDLALSHFEASRDTFAGLEWAFNELTDNVLNHAEAPDGGIAQASAFLANEEVHLIVADAGRGVLASMREGFPALETDEEAVGEALKEGVTRSAAVGQGNGLAGSLRIATMSSGTFQVLSGQALVKVFVDKESGEVAQRTARRPPTQRFHGTAVYVRLGLRSALSIEAALAFGGHAGVSPVDYVETRFGGPGEQLRLKVEDEAVGLGSRSAGAGLRTKVKNLLAAEPSATIVLDWGGVPMVSSSFADEFVGRLFLELGPTEFMRRIGSEHMDPVVRGLIDKAIMQRMRQ